MHKYLLNTFSVPGTVLGAKISVVRKTHKVSRSKEKREKRNCYYTHTMAYDLAIKKKVQIHAIMWINLANIMLSKNSQSQRTTHCRIPFV